MTSSYDWIGSVSRLLWRNDVSGAGGVWTLMALDRGSEFSSIEVDDTENGGVTVKCIYFLCGCDLLGKQVLRVLGTISKVGEERGGV
ncbi:hypothetical protein RB195_023659 [Necator americanus]|uniref:Uncharacterized protein n=1 Tax=Necator americanus TaxID=51031 RepID=A0ABR1EK41_NECAM